MSLTQGADVARLRQIAVAMGAQANRVHGVAAEIIAYSHVLETTWRGPDAERLVADVVSTQGQAEAAGQALRRFAQQAIEQADQQEQASGGVSGGSAGTRDLPGQPGPPPASDGPDRGLVADGANALRNGLGIARDGLGRAADALRDAIENGDAATRVDGGVTHPPADPDAIGTVNVAPNLIGDDDGTRQAPPERPGTSTLTVKPLPPPHTILVPEKRHTSGITLKPEAQISRTTSSPWVDAEGYTMQSSRYSAQFELAVEVRANSAALGLEAEQYIGGRLALDITARTGTLDGPIHPLDPLALPEGASMTLDGETYHGLGLEARFLALAIASDMESGAGFSVTIERGEGDLVTVLAGPDAYKKGVTTLGIPDTPLKVEAVQRYDEASLHKVTFDLSTSAGREAYNAMIFGAQLPDSTGPGVSEVSTVRSEKVTGSLLGAEGDVGRLTEYRSDGSSTNHWSSDFGRNKITGEEHYDTNGDLIPEKSVTRFTMPNVHQDVANNYNNSQDSSHRVDSAQNVVLEYSADDLAGLRDDAQKVIAGRINAGGKDFYPGMFEGSGGPVTQQDVQRILANPDNRSALGLGLDDPVLQLASATDDASTVKALDSHGGPLDAQAKLAYEHIYHYDSPLRSRADTHSRPVE